jgi:hypothetical protein
MAQEILPENGIPHCQLDNWRGGKMKRAIITLFLLAMIVISTIALTANYIVYHIELVGIDGKNVQLSILGEIHNYASY